jgi:hypothetical protein
VYKLNMQPKSRRYSPRPFQKSASPGLETSWPYPVFDDRTLGPRVERSAGGRIMNSGHATAGFVIKAGYVLLAAGVVVFVGMLVLTVLHP